MVGFALGVVIGPPAGAIALMIGFLAWLALFRGSFHTSWLGALGIVVLILDAILVALFGVKFPDFHPF